MLEFEPGERQAYQNQASQNEEKESFIEEDFTEGLPQRDRFPYPLRVKSHSHNAHDIDKD